MKRIMLATGLAIALLGSTLGVAYACSCTASGGASCTGTTCYTTRDGQCHCS